MKNLKDSTTIEMTNSVIERVNAARLALHSKAVTVLTDRQKSRVVGGSGTAPGTKVTFTGVIKYAVPILGDDNKTVVGCYEGAETTDGGYVSIAQLMGIASAAGYVTEDGKTVKNQYRMAHKGTVINNDFTVNVIKNFNFDHAWQPPTRQKYALISWLEENEILKGVVGTALGSIAKEGQARRDSPAGFREIWDAGDYRAMISKLWMLENSDGQNLNNVEFE